VVIVVVVRRRRRRLVVIIVMIIPMILLKDLQPSPLGARGRVAAPASIGSRGQSLRFCC
jgi:hypothetical protein